MENSSVMIEYRPERSPSTANVAVVNVSGSSLSCKRFVYIVVWSLSPLLTQQLVWPLYSAVSPVRQSLFRLSSLFSAARPPRL